MRGSLLSVSQCCLFPLPEKAPKRSKTAKVPPSTVLTANKQRRAANVTVMLVAPSCRKGWDVEEPSVLEQILWVFISPRALGVSWQLIHLFLGIQNKCSWGTQLPEAKIWSLLPVLLGRCFPVSRVVLGPHPPPLHPGCSRCVGITGQGTLAGLSPAGGTGARTPAEGVAVMPARQLLPPIPPRRGHRGWEWKLRR